MHIMHDNAQTCFQLTSVARRTCLEKEPNEVNEINKKFQRKKDVLSKGLERENKIKKSSKKADERRKDF